MSQNDVALILLVLWAVAMLLQSRTVLEDIANAQKGRRSPPPKDGGNWRTPPDEPKSGWMV